MVWETETCGCGSECDPVHFGIYSELCHGMYIYSLLVIISNESTNENVVYCDVNVTDSGKYVLGAV